MKVNQLRAGSFLSYLQIFLGLIINLLYTPVLLRMLGQSEYGLYTTVASTIAMLNVLNLGFTSSYIRFFSKYRAQNDETAIARLNGLYLIIFIIIAAVAGLCGFALSMNLEFVFAEGLTNAEYSTARTLMILLTVNLVCTFTMSLFSSIIAAHERFVFLKLFGKLKTVLAPLLTLPLMYLGYKSIAVVTVTLLVSVCTDIIYVVYAVKVLHAKFAFTDFEKGLFKSLLVFTSFIAVNMIVDQVNSNLGKFLLGRYAGTGAVAVYSVGYTLYSSYMMFSTAISGVFTPRIHKIVNATKTMLSEQRKQLSEIFIKVGRLQFIVLGLIATGFAFFGKSFIALWAGSGYDDAYYVTLLLILTSSIALIQNLGIEIQRALNKHHFRSIVYLGMALINLVLTMVLCQRYGVIGTAVGTATSLVVANGLIMNIYYHKKCNIDILLFWKNILRLAAGLILPVILGILAASLLDFSKPAIMLAGIMVYTIVYAVSMWLFGMNGYEKSLVQKPVGKICRKLKQVFVK